MTANFARTQKGQEALEEASAAMLQSKQSKSLGDGRRHRADNGGQRVEGESKDSKHKGSRRSIGQQ